MENILNKSNLQCLKKVTDISKCYKDINKDIQSIYKNLCIIEDEKTEILLNEYSDTFSSLYETTIRINSADCLISVSLCIIKFLKLNAFDDNLLIAFMRTPKNNIENPLLQTISSYLHDNNAFNAIVNAIVSQLSSQTWMSDGDLISMLDTVNNQQKTDFISIYLKSILFKKLADMLHSKMGNISCLELSKRLVIHVKDCQFIKQTLIRNNTRHILSAILQIHMSESCQFCSKTKCCNEISNLLTHILSATWINFGKYVFLTSFLREFSCDLVLSAEPQIVEILLRITVDYSLWSYISDVLVAILSAPKCASMLSVTNIFCSRFNEMTENFITNCFIPQLSTDHPQILLELIHSSNEREGCVEKYTVVSLHYLLHLCKKKIVKNDKRDVLLRSILTDRLISKLCKSSCAVEQEHILSIICKEICRKNYENPILWTHLLTFLTNNLTPSFSKFRQHLIKNVKVVLTTVAEDNQNKQKFLGQFVSLILLHLHPAASFYKRSLILAYTSLLIETGNCGILEQRLAQSESQVTGLLKTLLLFFTDSFEENRRLAAAVFVNLSGRLGQVSLDLRELAVIANQKTLSSNPADCVVAATLHRTLIQLTDRNVQSGSSLTCTEAGFIEHIIIGIEQSVVSIKDGLDLVHASVTAPFYSPLYCLRQLLRFRPLEADDDVTPARLLHLSRAVMLIVMPIIASSAPEGCLPEHLDPSFSADQSPVPGNHAEYVLVCCWRSCKEVANLMADLVERIVSRTNGAEHSQFLSEVCEFFLEHITQVTHKGAFESLSAGLTRIATALWRFRQLDGEEAMPMRMLKAGLQILDSGERQFYTRRSAGLPSLFLALIASEPPRDKVRTSLTLATDWIFRLLDSAAAKIDPSSVIHAFNILRLLFKESTLSHQMTYLTFVSFKYAIQYFTNSSWPIRNSATLLFCAIIERIFGPSKSSQCSHSYNKLNSKVFFNRYAGIYSFMLQFLQNHHSDDVTLKTSISVYPVLIVLSRLIPEPEEICQSLYPLDVFRDAAIRYLNSPVWIVRVAAAQVFASLSGNRAASVDRIIGIVSTHQSRQTDQPPPNNLLHGVVKCVCLLLGENAELVACDRVLLKETRHLLARAWSELAGLDGCHDLAWTELVLLTERLRQCGLPCPSGLEISRVVIAAESRWLQNRGASVTDLKLVFLAGQQTAAIVLRALGSGDFTVREEAIDQLRSHPQLVSTVFAGAEEDVQVRLLASGLDVTVGGEKVSSAVVRCCLERLEQVGGSLVERSALLLALGSRLVNSATASSFEVMRFVAACRRGCSYLGCTQLRLAAARGLSLYLANRQDQLTSAADVILAGLHDEDEAVRACWSSLADTPEVHPNVRAVASAGYQLTSHIGDEVASAVDAMTPSRPVFDVEEANLFYDIVEVARSIHGSQKREWADLARAHISVCELKDILEDSVTWRGGLAEHIYQLEDELNVTRE